MTEVDWAKAVEQGLYSVPLAARLLAARPDKVRSWVSGYANSGAAPILVRDIPAMGGRTVLSFLDLVESAFVRHFLSIGYSPQTIRKVALKLRQRHGVDHPFATNRRFKADGKTIFEESVSDAGERRLLDVMDNNFVLVPMVEPSLFDQVFYVDDVARRWKPLAQHARVVVDPKIAFGRPVVDRVWLPTETLFKAYLVEGGAEQAAEEWGVEPEDVLAAARFEQALELRTIH